MKARALATALLFLLLSATLQAAGPDDQFIRIYDLIEQADTLQQNGQPRAAYQQYLDAETKIKQLQTSYPSWNKETVQFRLEALQKKIAPLMARFDPPAEEKKPAPSPPRTAPARPPDAAALQPYLAQIRQLQAEKNLLQAKLEEALSARPAPADGIKPEQWKDLEKENALLRAALAKAPPSSEPAQVAMAPKPDRAATNRAAKVEASAAKAEWQKEKHRLELEVRNWQEADQKNQRVLKSLREENTALQTRLASARKPSDEESGKPKSNDREKVLRSQVEQLRQRIAQLEAEKIPYTAEELALIRKMPAPVAQTGTPPPRKAPRPLPAAAAALVTEARQAFNAQKYAEAEAKYKEVLRLDPSHPASLANLAAIQIEQNNLSEAATNLARALKVEPDDPFSLAMLGYLHLRQEKYDDAIDVLNRAAKLDPENPDIHNYLGIAFMEKGLRGPAETELRRALTIAPGYSRAHHNLAFIYATQKPPLLELANWHYDKALAAGHPPNSELEKLLGRSKPSE